MSQKLSCVQAYKIMYCYLNNIYFQTYDEFLSDILSGAAIYSDVEGKELETMDPALWYQWMDAVKIVMQDDTITFDSIELTIEQAYSAIYQYFVAYCNKGAEPSIFTLRDLLGTDIKQSNITRELWNKWTRSVEYILDEDPSKRMGHFFSEQTCIDVRKSFEVMKMFLDNYCQKYDNKNLIALVKNSRMKQNNNSSLEPSVIKSRAWNVWQQAIAMTMEQEKCESLNLLITFHSMLLFLLEYFDDNQVRTLKDMILKFMINKDKKAVNFSFWCDWTDAAVKLNAEQTELVYHLVSINTVISHEVAFTIVKAWLHKYEALLSLDIVQKILSDQTLWQQALDCIKNLQRSYLLLDDEVTILETYHIMLKILELAGKNIDEFAIDKEQQNKPKNFLILLEWIEVCEKIVTV